MCATCGCGRTGHDRDATHAGHDHELAELEFDVLAKNDHRAGHNREDFDRRGITVVNLMSSPGSGKTTLLERTARRLAGRMPIAVVEGDQETGLDADRIRATGAPVVQVNTGSGCHLDADMLARAVTGLDLTGGGLLVVENVGNLVCPALFDLGEHGRAVVMSVTEGADKPLKYPTMFRTADVVVLNKLDLLPHVDFDTDAFAGNLARVNPAATVLPVSATRGDGIEAWLAWLGRLGATPADPAMTEVTR